MAKSEPMNIQKEKLELISWIVESTDKSLIQHLQKLRTMDTKSADWDAVLKADQLENIYQKLMLIEEDIKARKDIADKLYEGYL